MPRKISMSDLDLKKEIQKLKQETNTVILAHNYQIPQVQDVADFVGDSLNLSRQAARVKEENILFCGVHFMAETAAIISPEKNVFIPDLEAGCSLSDSITIQQLREWKDSHPGAITVGYVNTTAEIKSELDYCCTSSNAIHVVNAIPKEKEILFLPDMFLGAYVAKMTNRDNMKIWAGECHVHAGITPDVVREKLAQLSNPEFIIHPECSCTTPILYDTVANGYGQQTINILSTEGMVKHVRESTAQNFLIATETGILHRMRQENPKKTFVAASDEAECKYMKMITLEKVYDSILRGQYQVTIPKDIADKARLSIQRMLELG